MNNYITMADDFYVVCPDIEYIEFFVKGNYKKEDLFKFVPDKNEIFLVKRKLKTQLIEMQIILDTFDIQKHIRIQK